MSTKIVSLDEFKKKEPKYTFISQAIKIERVNSQTGELTTDVEVVIKAKNLKTGKRRIHPYTEFLNSWSNSSIKHRVNKARNLVQFLNYIYFELGEKVLPDISELDFEIGIDFLNRYSKKVAKSTSDQMERTVAQFYYFLAKKEILKHIKVSDFKFTVPAGRDKEVMESPFNGFVKKNNKVHNQNKLHNIPTNLIVCFLETSQRVAPSITFGIYLQFFGGLRASEVVSVEYSDIALKGRAGRDGALIRLRRKDLRPDNKSSHQAQVKKPRDQRIFGLNGLFMTYFQNHKQIYKQEGQEHEAVFVNKYGKPMDYQSYNYYFNKVKKAFIEDLKNTNNPDLHTYALYLQTQDWSSHIGRGVFSNIVSEVSNNAVELANARGDSTLNASLTYITDTQAMDEKVYDLMNERCSKLFQEDIGE